MISSMESAASGAQPLNIRIARERERRGWTQKDVAARAGIPLRTYTAFETGETKNLQAKNRRALLAVFGWDDHGERGGELAEDFCEHCGRPVWENRIEVFNATVGAFLSTMTQQERLAFMAEVTRKLVEHRE